MITFGIIILLLLASSLWATHCGQGGNLKFGSTVFPVFDWTLDEKVRLIETTDTNSAGYAKWQGCLVEGSVAFNFAWDDTLIPESILTTATLTLDLIVGDSGKKYTAVPVKIESIQVKNDARGIVTGAATAKTAGVIPIPA